MDLVTDTHYKSVDKFSIDADGINRWKFKEYKYIPNPANSSNVNPFAAQAYIEHGLGCCAACGHSPIVNHFFISHHDKGTVAVGSECIKKVLNVRVEKALKAAVTRASKEYLTKIRNWKFYNDFRQWYNEHQEMKNIVTGHYIEKWERRYECCNQSESICEKCYGDRWADKKEYFKNNPECPNNNRCLYHNPIEPQYTVDKIFGMIENAYIRNHKDVSYIFREIENFNESQIKTNSYEYNGGIPPQIPGFILRNFKKEPLNEEEQKGKEEAIEAEINSMNIRF